ncbi:M15 family metallopeptidase [Micromonospora sp. NPDC049836]|uniref:M15 family metallopeptidase n=1 Tax=Micromonospora sp. NPDC049836 TaxID=3364274 RepID=UPI0037975ACE
MTGVDGVRSVILHVARWARLMSAAERARRRDRVYQVVTLLLAALLLPLALVVAPGRARRLAGRWALAIRFPTEDLTGLTPETRAAFEAARTRALWRHGELIGLTSGHRPAEEQARLFAAAVRRSGSPEAARRWVLPPQESRHVAGVALDVRPVEGARWLERHGARHHLHRVYDNEWWHFEYLPGRPPDRLPHPGASRSRRPVGPSACAGTRPARSIRSSGCRPR